MMTRTRRRTTTVTMSSQLSDRPTVRSLGSDRRFSIAWWRRSPLGCQHSWHARFFTTKTQPQPHPSSCAHFWQAESGPTPTPTPYPYLLLPLPLPLPLPLRLSLPPAHYPEHHTDVNRRAAPSSLRPTARPAARQPTSPAPTTANIWGGTLSWEDRLRSHCTSCGGRVRRSEWA
jgi:hypothetical protein